MCKGVLYLNGINGVDGNYLMPELTVEQILRLAQGGEAVGVQGWQPARCSDGMFWNEVYGPCRGPQQ